MASQEYGSSVIFEDGSKSKPDPTSVFMRAMDIVNTITHFALGSVAFAVFSLSMLINSNKLSQHMILCVLGYVVLMTQSILVMSSNNGWSKSYNDQERRKVHLVMQIVGSILAIAGSAIAISETNFSFNSTHGGLGIVAMALTFISLLGGVLRLYTTCNPRVTHFMHCFVGCLTITVAFTSLMYGIQDIYRIVYGSRSANFLTAIAVIGLAGTIFPSFIKVIKKQH